MALLFNFFQPHPLNSGETGFLFTQFTSGVQWLESKESEKANNFKLSTEQFELYKSGILSPEEFQKRSYKIIENGMLEIENTCQLIESMIQGL